MTLVVGTNSYIDRADADTYFEDAIHAAPWTASSNDTKEDALVTATRMLDRQEWVGTKTNPLQALDWPRTGVTYSDGTAVDPLTVPQFILDATCELALALIVNPSIQSSTNSGSNVKRLKAGSAEIEYFNSTSGAGRFPTIVAELVNPYLASSVNLSAPFFGDTEATLEIRDYPLTREL